MSDHGSAVENHQLLGHRRQCAGLFGLWPSAIVFALQLGGELVEFNIIFAITAAILTHRVPGNAKAHPWKLTERESEVLALMAEGHSNAAICDKLYFSQSAATKHINATFTKLSIPPTRSTNRRVLALLKYLAGYAQRDRGQNQGRR